MSFYDGHCHLIDKSKLDGASGSAEMAPDV